MATTPAVALWQVQGDAVMALADEEQYALTAADTLGPLAPAALRSLWLTGGAVSGHLPWLHVGSFTAPGAFIGALDVALEADPGGRSSWGYGSGGNAGLALFLVDIGAIGGLPVSGPWPFSGRVDGVVVPVNYPQPAPFAVLAYTPQMGGTPGRVRNINDDPPFGVAYGLGYADDAIEGYGQISPTPCWSTSDGMGGQTYQGGVSVVSDFPVDAQWPLAEGHAYAVMAVPCPNPNLSLRQSWANVYPLPTPGNPPIRGAALVGTGYEDYPSHGTGPTDHWTLPDVHGWFPFGWPQYDPPIIPPGYALIQGHTGTTITPPASTAPTEHFRTGQRLHLEAYAIKVAAVGTPTGPQEPPGSSSSGFPWWVVALAGAGVGVAVIASKRDQHRR